MKNHIKKPIMFLAVLVMTNQVWASDPGTSSAIILKHNLSTRAEAMGDAHVAVSDDQPGAARWNPAGLYNAYHQEVNVSYYRGLVDDFFGAINYSQTLGKELSIGGSFLFYDAGQFELNILDIDNLSVRTSQVAAERDVLGIITGAYKLNLFDRDVLLGANLKLIYSTLLESESAFAAAIDIGAMTELQELLENLQIGLMIKNIGTPMKYIDQADPLPTQVLAGAAYRLLKSKEHNFLIAADVMLDWENDFRGNLGLEYWRNETIAVRAGYKLGYDLDTLTLGFGVRLLPIQLDYSFAMKSELNSTHKLSVNYVFATDKIRKKEVLKEISVPEPKPTPVLVVEVPQPMALPTPQPTPIPTVMAEILGTEAVGGEVKTIILSIGLNRKIRQGYSGKVLNSSNIEIAKIKIIEVYPTRCLAKIVERSGKIDSGTKVEIVKKKKP